MKPNKISYLLAAGMLIFSTLACNLGKSPDPYAPLPPQGTTNEGTPAVATEVPADNSASSGGGGCANPYLPIVTGATWTYKLTGPVADTYTRTVLSVDAASFTDLDAFGSGVTRQSQWKCDNGNLASLSPDNGTSSSVKSENVSIDYQTTDFSGITLPATINAGDTWTQSMKLEGVETINGTPNPVKNQTTNTCTAIGIESVTVEAGTFDAMHFDCQTNINIVITMNGSDIPASLTLNSSNWHALNIGLIKTITTGEGFNSAVELISYSIP